MAIVPCFGCVRWDDLGPTSEKVIIRATDRNKRKTADVSTNLAGQPIRYREHTFYLCCLCQWMFDEDLGFRERMASKASGIASGG